ncbi:MAG: tetratricopeptide repeat protein [Candidatus Muiribacteriota bacterium]
MHHKKVKQIILFALLSLLLTGCAAKNTDKSVQSQKKNKKIQQVKIIPEGNSYFNFLVSELALKDNDTKKSISFLIKAHEKDSDSYFLKKALARKYIIIKKAEKAETLINEVLEKHPDDTRALGLKAAAAALQNKPVEDIAEIYKKIIELDPDNSKAPIALSYLYKNMGKTEELIEIFEKASKKTEDNYFLYYHLGETYLGTKKYQHARDTLYKAVKSQPDRIQPKLSLIETIKKMSDNSENKEEITNLFREIISLKPDRIEPLVELSFYYNNHGDYEEADNTFKPVAEEYSKNEKDINRLLHNYIKNKEFKKSDFLVSKIYQSTGDDKIYMVLGALYSKEGFKNKALSAYKSIPDDSENYTNASATSAFIHADNKNYKKAVSILKKALEVNPKNSLLLITLGNIYEEQQEYEKAVNTYKKGLDFASEDDRLWSFYYRLGVVYDKQNNKEKSIEMMKKALNLKPDNPDTLNYLGYTYADMGINLDQAEEMILKALALKENDGYITDSLGWVYFKQGKIDKALKHLLKAAKLVKDDPIIYEHLGDVYRHKDDLKKALENYKKALKIDPENQTVKEKIEEVKN